MFMHTHLEDILLNYFLINVKTSIQGISFKSLIQTFTYERLFTWADTTSPTTQSLRSKLAISKIYPL